ncbi:glycosyltransferase [Lacinutrix sp. Bg11-31]|uniref:glycosyltransferase n=1 Tax=Lacinutrix sp. Bg11-31 TaxID=2057808 RepID=UPI000C30652D|nr:glycosyltransferase [Lacinutrix sp. Bg11-31]AUC82544.1 family 2 glycosyl transferase [Lacinutrix sp. Bg11-31]
MKTGIIIIFHNNEKDIDINVFIEQIKQTSNLELCLVNNDSRDNTFQLLKEIKEASSNVSVVNVKKIKSDVSAVRAGARFMSNQFNLIHLGYVAVNSLNTNKHGLNGLIKAIAENQEVLLDYNLEILKRKNIKLTLFQSLFSIIDYLKKLKVKNQFVQLQILSKS